VTRFTTWTNQNSIYEEFKSKFCLGSSCYHSFQGFCFCLLSQNVKIKTHETKIFSCCHFGHWSMVLLFLMLEPSLNTSNGFGVYILHWMWSTIIMFWQLCTQLSGYHTVLWILLQVAPHKMQAVIKCFGSLLWNIVGRRWDIDVLCLLCLDSV